MPDPLHTPVCELLGIELPIAQAPMVGPGTPELAGAVSAAGGLGCVGLTGLTATAAGQATARAVALSGGRPVCANVQVAPPRAATTTAEALAPVLQALAEPVPPAPSSAPATPEALLEAALEAGAAVISTALGDPARLARPGVPLIASVSTVEEARRAEAAGAAVVVAQGAEAGGHRTTWDVDAGALPLVGTMALVPRVADAVSVPVLAAGAVFDGRGVAAALALGAAGVWVGTRFMSCREAGLAPAQRRLLAALTEDATLVTDAVTGRHARWVRTAPVEALLAGPGHLGWPAQGAVVRPLFTALADTDRAALLAGQGGGTAPDGEAAGDVVRGLAGEARAVLRRLAG